MRMTVSSSLNFGVGFFIFGWLFFSAIISFIYKRYTNRNENPIRKITSIITIAATGAGMLFYMITGLSDNNAYRIIASVIGTAAISMNVILFIKDLSAAVKKEFH